MDKDAQIAEQTQTIIDLKTEREFDSVIIESQKSTIQRLRIGVILLAVASIISIILIS